MQSAISVLPQAESPVVAAPVSIQPETPASTRSESEIPASAQSTLVAPQPVRRFMLQIPTTPMTPAVSSAGSSVYPTPASSSAFAAKLHQFQVTSSHCTPTNYSPLQFGKRKPEQIGRFLVTDLSPDKVMNPHTR